MSAEFWKTWANSDEIARLKLVKTLPPFRRGGIGHYVTAGLVNSYLVGLYNYAKKEEPSKKKPKVKE
jgi:hypothetical protein